MALLKHDRVINDPWAEVDDDSPLPPGQAIVSCTRWLSERDALSSRSGAIGIRIAGDQPIEPIACDVHRFGLICLEIPNVPDGRAYSCARILRGRYGYRGELRAVGNVLRGQLLFLRRCGFDAFAIPGDADARDWVATSRDYTMRYQPSVDRASTTSQLTADGAADTAEPV